MQNQKRRELSSMQVMYFRDMLIPSDPLEQGMCSDGPSTVKGPTTTSTTTVSEPIKRSLDEFYYDWKRDQEERKKEITTAHTLCETLKQGLYSQSPHVVFKVIADLKIEVIGDDVRDKLAMALVQGVWSN